MVANIHLQTSYRVQQNKRPYAYQAKAVNTPSHVLLWPEATDSRAHPAAMPTAAANEEDCVANMDFSSGQSLWKERCPVEDSKMECALSLMKYTTSLVIIYCYINNSNIHCQSIQYVLSWAKHCHIKITVNHSPYALSICACSIE